jgi:hypothetical protein
MSRSRPTRRRFLASAGAVVLAAPTILRAASPNEKLGMAVIGCGGQGSGNPGLAARERLVALVDVDEKKIAEALKKLPAKTPEPKVFHD